MSIRMSVLAVAAAAAVLITGCATREGSAGVGALTGAAVGAGIGYAIEGNADGAIMGDLAGALAGGVIGYAVGVKLEDQEETLVEYPEIRERYERPGVDEVLDIRQLTVTPDQQLAGEEVEVRVIHSFVSDVERTRPFDVEVTLVDSAGRVLLTEQQRQEYENGTYRSTITFRVPPELEPGLYGIDVSMHAGSVTDNQSATLRVI